MKKHIATLLTLALIGLTACQRSDTESNGFLTSTDSVKRGIVGTWKYKRINADGSGNILNDRFYVFQEDGSWHTYVHGTSLIEYGTYTIIRYEWGYLLRIYQVSGGNLYANHYPIKTLTHDALVYTSYNETHSSRYVLIRVNK